MNQLVCASLSVRDLLKGVDKTKVFIVAEKGVVECP